MYGSSSPKRDYEHVLSSFTIFSVKSLNYFQLANRSKLRTASWDFVVASEYCLFVDEHVLDATFFGFRQIGMLGVNHGACSTCLSEITELTSEHACGMVFIHRLVTAMWPGLFRLGELKDRKTILKQHSNITTQQHNNTTPPHNNSTTQQHTTTITSSKLKS